MLSPSRRQGLRSLAWQLDAPRAVVAMFVAAFFLRLLIAPHVGFYGDLGTLEVWAERLARVGPRDFYGGNNIQDYPPGYLYILWLVSQIDATPGYLLKLPALLGDLALAVVAGTFAARSAQAALRERWPVRTLVAAAVLFNPAVIALSAVWGQVDVVPIVFVLWSLLLLFTGPRKLPQDIAAFLLFAVAFAMKPQSGFVLPVMLYALYRRHLHRRSGHELIGGVGSIALSGALSLGLWSVSGLAFGLGPIELVRFYQRAASVYPVTSANAFNLWGVVGFWRPDSTYKLVGAVALVVGITYVLWAAHRAIGRGADEARVLMVSAASTSLLAFTLLTRMHERYMFLSIAVLSPLVFERRLRLTLAALSGLFILNLWWPYANSNAQLHHEDLRVQPWFDWIFGADFGMNTWQKKGWSLAVVVVTLVLVWRGPRWAAEAGRPPARELQAVVGGPKMQQAVFKR